MHPVRWTLVVAAVLLLAGCARASATPAWTAPTVTAAPSAPAAAPSGSSANAGPSASGAPTGQPSTAPLGTASGTRIEVKLTDQLKMEPATLNVPVGRPVTFVVTNSGAIAHEFFVGDTAAQDAHEKAMTGATSPPPDSPNGIGVMPGQTKELTITFQQAATWLAGCHVSGHYLAGMKATITIQ